MTEEEKQNQNFANQKKQGEELRELVSDLKNSIKKFTNVKKKNRIMQAQMGRIIETQCGTEIENGVQEYNQQINQESLISSQEEKHSVEIVDQSQMSQKKTKTRSFKSAGRKHYKGVSQVSTKTDFMKNP